MFGRSTPSDKEHSVRFWDYSDRQDSDPDTELSELLADFNQILWNVRPSTKDQSVRFWDWSWSGSASGFGFVFRINFPTFPALIIYFFGRSRPSNMETRLDFRTDPIQIIRNDPRLFFPLFHHWEIGRFKALKLSKDLIWKYISSVVYSRTNMWLCHF